MFVIRDCGAHPRIQTSETHAEMTETTSDPNELCRTNCAGPEQATSTKHQAPKTSFKAACCSGCQE